MCGENNGIVCKIVFPFYISEWNYDFVFFLCFSLPLATGAMYVRQFFDEKSRKMAINVAKEIHEAFIETLKKVQWLDDESRTVAIEKANAMKFHIGYPDALMNDTILDEFYKDLELQPDSFLHSMLYAQKFLTDRLIKLLYKPVDKNDWIEQSMRLTNVDAFYSLFENSIRMLANNLSLFDSIESNRMYGWSFSGN